MRFVGFDPGGEKAFGWAVVESTREGLHFVSGGVVTGAPAALAQSSAVLLEAPAAVGIDAPLFWVCEGDRKVDSQVRALVCGAGGHAGTVSHVNSLRGACLVQGVLVARLSREQWPAASMTEAHPKALLRVSGAARAFVSAPELRGVSEHVRDAALGAYAAHAYVTQALGWHNLLAQERAPFFPGGTEVAYWFPKQRT
jgi:predicted nuclease with RNAse H fold